MAAKLIEFFIEKICDDSQEKPQSRITVFPMYQKKERWETNNDKTNATW